MVRLEIGMGMNVTNINGEHLHSSMVRLEILREIILRSKNERFTFQYG